MPKSVSSTVRFLSRLPLADVDLDRLEKEIQAEARYAPRGVSFTSRGRRYTFWWHRKGGRLLVKVGGLSYEAKPAIEALARKLADVRVCPDCGTAFARRGRQRYCSAAHAARSRKRRWTRRAQAEQAE
jgi:hypothetical protein